MAEFQVGKDTLRVLMEFGASKCVRLTPKATRRGMGIPRFFCIPSSMTLRVGHFLSFDLHV